MWLSSAGMVEDAGLRSWSSIWVLDVAKSAG
jgi:hypothetical protein